MITINSRKVYLLTAFCSMEKNVCLCFLRMFSNSTCGKLSPSSLRCLQTIVLSSL